MNRDGIFPATFNDIDLILCVFSIYALLLCFFFWSWLFMLNCMQASIGSNGAARLCGQPFYRYQPLSHQKKGDPKNLLHIIFPLKVKCQIPNRFFKKKILIFNDLVQVNLLYFMHVLTISFNFIIKKCFLF